MGIYNPLYNEETGWTPLDQLQPWQQALMNPSAGGAGYNTSPMQMDMFSQIANQGSTLANPGGSNNFVGVPQQQATNPFLSQPTANSMYGAGNMTGTSGASSQSPVIGSPSLATNMGMTGAQNVGGVGMYTGANGPLDMNLFAPQGQDAAIMQGSMGGLGEMLYKAAQQGGLNPNTSYLGFIDDLSRRALAAKGGQGGLLPQDFVNYMNSQAGQQWFQGMRTPAPGTPTGSPVIQQTGPQNPPVAPLPSQQVRPPGSGANSLITGGPDYGQTSMRGYPGMNSGGGYNPNYGGPQVDPAQGNMLQNIPMTPQQRQQYEIGMNRYRQGGTYFDPAYVEYLLANQMQPGQNPYQMGQQTPVIGSPGMIGRPTSGLQMTPEQAQSYGVSSRQLTPEEQAWYRQYGTLAGLPGQAKFANQQQIPNPSGGYYPQAPNSVYSPEELQQYSSITQPNWNSLTDYGRQQMGMPTEAEWRQMQSRQQAPPQYGQQVDYRAATYGTQPQTPAPTGSNTIPNTTNPLNPLTSQTQYRAPGFGSVTNRLSGFGNTSLFGTPYGSGGSTGFGGTNPSQYRGAGIYGRAASYGQSQRPY